MPTLEVVRIRKTRDHCAQELQNRCIADTQSLEMAAYQIGGACFSPLGYLSWHQGGPDEGLRYCWAARQRSDPMNLIQFMLA